MRESQRIMGSCNFNNSHMQILQNRALDKLRTQRRPELLSMDLHLEIVGRDLSNCKIGTSKVLEGRMLKWAIVASVGQISSNC